MIIKFVVHLTPLFEYYIDYIFFLFVDNLIIEGGCISTLKTLKPTKIATKPALVYFTHYYIVIYRCGH